MLELKRYNGSLVTPRDDALLHDFLINDTGIFEGLTVTHLGSNQLLISAGRGIIKGRDFTAEEETILAQLSDSGEQKGRLLIRVDISNEESPIQFATQAAASLPELTQEDINRGGTVYELAIAEYDVDELQISNLTYVAKTVLPQGGLYPATCTYSGGDFTLSGLPATLSDIFTVRFKAPADYIEGDTFSIGTTKLQAKLANQDAAPSELFMANAVLSMEVDLVGKTAFFKTGGGGFPDGWNDVRTAEALDSVTKNQAVVFWTDEVAQKDVVSPFERVSNKSFMPPGLIGISTQNAALGHPCKVNLFPALNLIPTYDPVLDNNTWKQIEQASENAEASAIWSIGDTKQFMIDGVGYTARIIGFDHDTLTVGGTAGITFELQTCLSSTYAMNATNTNAGGWENAAMRNTRMATLFTQFPADLQAVIKTVNKFTSAGSQSSTINATSDKLFLLSEIEVYGVTFLSVAGEGSQYEYYQSGNSRVKTVNGSAHSWWMRSPNGGNATSFCTVSNTGNALGNSAGNALGVSFSFCV